MVLRMPHCRHYSQKKSVSSFPCAILLVSDQQASTWLQNPSSEVEIEILQAELRRTHRIVSGYGSLLERCEASQRRQIVGNTIFCAILFVLSSLSFFCQLVPLSITTAIAEVGAGHSSDSDNPGSKSQALPFKVAGPQRPWTLSRRQT